MLLSCPGGWGRGCLGPCLTRSSECPLMAVGARGAGGMGLAAGSGRAWDLALVPNLLQASPFPSLSLSFLLQSGERWLGEGGAPSTTVEMGKLRLQGNQAGADSQHCPELLPRPFRPLLPGPLLQLSLCISLTASVSLSISLSFSICLYLHFCIFLCSLPFHLFSPTTPLSVCLSVCLRYVSLIPFSALSLHQSVCLSLPVCLTLPLPVFFPPI